jgi:hypothetical protein
MMVCMLLSRLYVLCLVALHSFWSVRGDCIFSRVLSRVNIALMFNSFMPSRFYTYHNIYQNRQVALKVCIFFQEFSIKPYLSPYTSLIDWPLFYKGNVYELVFL